MTVEEIKESGKLEEFVFGNPSQQNIELVENWIIRYPEIKDYVNDLEITAEKLAFENATSPPANWKSDILSESQNTKNDTKINPLNKYVAFGFALLLGGLVGAGLVYGKLKNTESDFNSLQKDYAELVEDCSKDKSLFADNENLLNYIQDRDTEAISLRQQIDRDNSVIVFWNQRQRKAIASIEGLSPLDSDKSYQIWADVEGEMISLGLLEQQSNRFVSLDYLDNAESLNITIEPKGGSEHPTVSRLIMSAKV